MELRGLEEAHQDHVEWEHNQDCERKQDGVDDGRFISIHDQAANKCSAIHSCAGTRDTTLSGRLDHVHLEVPCFPSACAPTAEGFEVCQVP